MMKAGWAEGWGQNFDVLELYLGELGGGHLYPTDF